MRPDESMSTHSDISIAVVGLGDVGQAFGRVLPTLGDDLSGEMGAAAFSEAALPAAGFQVWRL